MVFTCRSSQFPSRSIVIFVMFSVPLCQYFTGSEEWHFNYLHSAILAPRYLVEWGPDVRTSSAAASEASRKAVARGAPSSLDDVFTPLGESLGNGLSM